MRACIRVRDNATTMPRTVRFVGIRSVMNDNRLDRVDARMIFYSLIGLKANDKPEARGETRARGVVSAEGP